MAANVKVLAYIGHQKGHITKAKEHVKYMVAPREHHRNNPHLFDENRDYVNRREFFDRLEQQKPSPRHAFMHKMVITLSEEEQGRLKTDLRELARDTMARFEGKSGHRIDWVAAIHDDKGHPHVHIAFRGRDKDGKPIFIGKEQIRQLRQMADQEKVRQAERTLGPHKAHEILGKMRLEQAKQQTSELNQKMQGRSNEQKHGFYHDSKQGSSHNLGHDLSHALMGGFQQLIREANHERERAQAKYNRRQQLKSEREKKKRGRGGMER